MTARCTPRFLPIAALAFVITGAIASACTPKNTASVAAPVAPKVGVDLDADAAALLPFGALAVANLDAHAITNSTVGGDLTALGERMIPFAGQMDFQIKRDLNHAYVALYSFSGADVLGVLTGTFHPDKLDEAAARGLNTAYGVVVASTYAGRKLYTVANIGFTMLSARTALAGSETAMRRALDRIQSGSLKREIAPWMSDWVSQSGYPVLIASDVTKQSFGKTITSYLPWVQGVQYVRVRGRFNPDTSYGMSGAMTYPDGQKAAAAAQGLSAIPKSFAMMAVLKMIGIAPLVRNMTVNASGNDVQFSTVLDESQTRSMIQLLTGWLASGNGAMPSLPSPPAAPSGSSSGAGPAGTSI
ncbi:MAG: hypothetical protein NVSMB1_26520 [Polyangiales bacterium]